MAVNGLENAVKNAMDNPNLEEPNFDKPAMDDEATANLVTMFSSVCKAFALAPKDALAVLSAQEWDDNENIVTHIRQGF